MRIVAVETKTKAELKFFTNIFLEMIFFGYGLNFLINTSSNA